MRSKQFLILFLLGVSLFYSCSSSVATTPPPDSRTREFNTYLKLNFGDSIPADHHLYVLVSRKESRENIASVLQRILPMVRKRPAGSLSFLVSVDVPVADSLLPLGARTDWDDAVDHLTLLSSGVTIVQTGDQRVVTVAALSADNAGNESGWFEW